MLPIGRHLHEKQNRIYAPFLFGKCQDKSQIIKAAVKHLKLNTNKHFNIFRSFWSQNAVESENKKILRKKQDHTQQLQSIHQAAS